MTNHESSKLPELIVLTGLDGSGKGHLAAHLRDQEGFLALGASDIIRRAIASQPDLEGLPLDEATRRLKTLLGPTFITDTAVERYRRAQSAYTGLAIDGLRRLPEIERFKNLGGTAVHVDADNQGRFERLEARGRHDAPTTIEEMLARDAQQLDGDPADKNSLNMRAIIGMADVVVTNRFDDKFTAEAIEVLRKRT